MLSLPDLVRSKKTQRDKDWPMIRRLVEADLGRAGVSAATQERVLFWLAESRTPSQLTDLVLGYPEIASSLDRPALVAARGNRASSGGRSDRPAPGDP